MVKSSRMGTLVYWKGIVVILQVVITLRQILLGVLVLQPLISLYCKQSAILYGMFNNDDPIALR